jgi:carboxynorspermidine decarboxylase
MKAGIGQRRTGAVVVGETACRRAEGLAGIVRAVETPAFVIDERAIVEAAHRGSQIARQCGFRLLYALKPLPDARVLSLMAPWLDGFSAGSTFEARLARSVLGESGPVHVTSPGIRERDVDELADLCDHVALNSLSQLHRLGPALRRPGQLGLRINPQLSLVDDERYDPCRRHSKLGVPLDALLARLARDPGLLDGVRGLLVHSHCDSPDFAPLLRTVRHIEDALGDRLDRLDWINLGGGYLLGPAADVSALREAVSRLRDGHGLTVFIEPGAALVRAAGFLVAEVIDLFRSQGKRVAVLDTTVNHFPEAFEYPFEPDVPGHDDRAEHEYLLAGCSCLAGDVLGEYGFDRPLGIGSRVALPDLGAYSFVKAHMFNGINLPAVYTVRQDGKPALRRRFHYQDFLSRFGASCDAAV